MTSPKGKRDELAEHLAAVFRERYRELVEEKGHDEAYREALDAMQRTMEENLKEGDR
ncbi:hypothetical protein [Rubrobacter marinus]|uniref:hypothetical protein n=1 Tax=Rubrobacter marinus TaxID=2653852 RepID=UPI0014076CF7|nr:hypothetical protein [Rubrobacter marinus]